MRITFRSESRPFLDMGSTQSIVGDDHTLLEAMITRCSDMSCIKQRATCAKWPG